MIYDHDRKPMALGLYDPDSPIRIRVLHRGGSRAIDRAFFAERLRAAAALRAHLPGEGTTGYRLASGESDGLPGLVVDRYGETCVVKLYSGAWLPHLAAVQAALVGGRRARTRGAPTGASDRGAGRGARRPRRRRAAAPACR